MNAQFPNTQQHERETLMKSPITLTQQRRVPMHRRLLLAACLLMGATLAAFATPPGITDAAGNYVSNLPYTSGDTYIYEPNAAPTDILLAGSGVFQSAGSNGTVGALYTEDADAGDAHTYTLVDGVGSEFNSLFHITENFLLANNAAAIPEIGRAHV